MATEFKFVAIPEAFARLIGVADDGTRIFRAEGNHAAMRRWFDALANISDRVCRPEGLPCTRKLVALLSINE